MRIFVIVILFISAIQNSGIAQSTRFGLKSGFNVSAFSASINSESDFKTGFHLGAFVRTPINNKFFFRPEVYYSSQGQKDNYINNSGSTTTTINYLNIPVLFEIGRRFAFQVGPQLGFLLSAHEKGTIQGAAVNDDLEEITMKTDVSIILGMSGYVGKSINIGVRFQRGLSPIFEEPPGFNGIYPKVQNIVAHFFVGVLFSKTSNSE